MIITHDNTSVISSYRYLTRQSINSIKQPYDLQNFLGLLTSYALSDQILIPGFVHDSVANQRESAIDKLESLGLSRSFFEVDPESEDEFKARCRATVNTFLEDISDDPQQHISELFLNTKLDFKISEDHLDHAEDIHSLFFAKNRKEIIENIRNGEIDKEYGTAGYMLTINQNLYDLIFDRRDDWSLLATQKLIDLFRYKLNFSLKKSSMTGYSPNVKRAKIIDGYQRIIRNGIKESLIGSLDEIIVGGQNELINSEPINLPGISRALIYDSAGDLDRLIELSIETRDNTKPLRDFINKTINKIDNEPQKWFELEKGLKEIGSEVKIGKEGLKDDGALFSKVSITGIPIPYPTKKGISKAKNHLLRKKEINVLSEFASSVQNPINMEINSFVKLFKVGNKND
ncbi:hypothetical protein [Ekhidna sp.]|uniref:hypothetical protein n=1 Tax=Ekhidna sp. TaxID=2608089 RepID=UPI003BAA4C34